MQSKLVYSVIALLLLVGMGVYFYLNPSYKLSLEARIYYTIGDYVSAKESASRAYEMNPYNRMAFTVMVQSTTAMKYREYIAMAKEYYSQIKEISQKDNIGKADRAKVKMLAEVVIQSHERLVPTRLTDRELIEDAAYYKDAFVSLYEKLFDTKLRERPEQKSQSEEQPDA